MDDREELLTSINSIKQILALSWFLDISVDKEWIHLRVYVFNHDLEPVEAAGLGDLDLVTEALDKVFVDNTIRGGEEGQHMGDKVALIVCQAVVPIVLVFGKVDFFGRPEGSLGLLVELPNLRERVWVSIV